MAFAVDIFVGYANEELQNSALAIGPGIHFEVVHGAGKFENSLRPERVLFVRTPIIT
jgi:hypothetical protein